MKLEITLRIYQVAGPTTTREFFFGIVIPMDDPCKSRGRALRGMADQAIFYSFRQNFEMAFRSISQETGLKAWAACVGFMRDLWGDRDTPVHIGAVLPRCTGKHYQDK